MQYTVSALGNKAAMLSLGNQVDPVLHGKIMAMYAWLSDQSFIGLKDMVIAYSSLTIIYEPAEVRNAYHPIGTVFQWVAMQLEIAFENAVPSVNDSPSQVFEVPVCYDVSLGFDLPQLCESLNMPVEEIISRHSSATYLVFMNGFLPGFAYLGLLDEKLSQPRKRQTVPVKSGSIGITGRQTGIYPLDSPGGWHIIGRTLLKLFDTANPHPALLTAGMHVKFQPISLEAYRQRMEEETLHSTGQ
jgi:inhibitor of KinA